jgi:hypothetical protein
MTVGADLPTVRGRGVMPSGPMFVAPPRTRAGQERAADGSTGGCVIDATRE